MISLSLYIYIHIYICMYIYIYIYVYIYIYNLHVWDFGLAVCGLGFGGLVPSGFRVSGAVVWPSRNGSRSGGSARGRRCEGRAGPSADLKVKSFAAFC